MGMTKIDLIASGLMPVREGLSDSKVDQVYEVLAQALIQGQMPPLVSVSLRQLAQKLGVSPMPVREAVRRLVAEKALEVQTSNKRLRVPLLSEDRLRQLMKARGFIEPELAFMATQALSLEHRAQLVARLKAYDADLMQAIAAMDVDRYMRANHDFHFKVYRAAGADLLLDMTRTLWLQSGPFMRMVFMRLPHGHVIPDHHQALIKALAEQNSDGVRVAMRDDIYEGMNLMLSAIKAQGGQPKA
jgi:DNA-binding GntR family transcriptional regulator